jgi:hypothetical protein
MKNKRRQAFLAVALAFNEILALGKKSRPKIGPKLMISYFHLRQVCWIKNFFRLGRDVQPPKLQIVFVTQRAPTADESAHIALKFSDKGFVFAFASYRLSVAKRLSPVQVPAALAIPDHRLLTAAPVHLVLLDRYVDFVYGLAHSSAEVAAICHN